MRGKKILILAIALLMFICLLTACSGKVFSIEFYVDGAFYASYKVEKGKSLDDVPDVPQKEGYIGKWDVTNFDEITESMTVNAIYTANTYTVTFVADGVVIAKENATVGKTISKIPDVPAKEGYSGEWNITSYVGLTKDTTVTAIYTLNDVYVTFYNNNFIYSPATVKIGDAVTPNKYFELKEDAYEFTTDTRFVANKVYFTGVREIFAKVKAENGALTDVPAPPKQDGFSVKWMQIVETKDGETYITPNFNAVTKDVGVVAYKYVTVKLIDEKASQPVSYEINCDVGEKLSNIAQIVSEKEGYEFYGWYYESTLQNKVEYPCDFAQNTTLYAKWVSIRDTEGLVYDGSKVVSYGGTETEIFVPYKYKNEEGKEFVVTEIAEGAFEGGLLTKINLPNTIEIIGDNAFYNCTSLVTVTFEDGCYVVSVGKNAFYGCGELKSFTFSSKTAEIGEKAFYNCSSLVELTALEETKISIVPTEAFFGCSTLANVYLPASVKNIEARAFANAYAAEIHFSDGTELEKIGDFAFSNCYKFTGVTAPALKEQGVSVFAGCYGLTEATMLSDKLVCELFSTETVSDGNFYAVTVAENTYYVPKLLYFVTVTGGEGIVKENAFFDCYSVKNVVLVSGITQIAKYAFNVVNYPISSAEFKLTLPDTLVTVSEYAAYGRNDIATISIPSTVNEIGEKAFYGVSALYKVDVPTKNSLSKIGAYAFDGTAWHNDYAGLIKLGSVVVGISENYCRKNGKTEITAAEMSGLKSIVSYAFADNAVIQKITLGNEISSVGDFAFKSCSALNTFVFNSNVGNAMVRDLGKTVFDGCSALSDLTIYEDILLSDLFTTVPTTFDVLRLRYDGLNAVIDAGLYSGYSDLKKIYIGDGYTSVAENAFINNSSLTEVYFGNDIVSIDKNAFANNTSLTTVDFSANSALTSVGESAFSDTGLTALALPSTVTTIAKNAFMNTKITSFTAPNELTSIGENAFFGVTQLTSVTLNEKLTEIKEYAFRNCNLRRLGLPKATVVNRGILLGNANLSELTLNSGFSVSLLFTEGEGETAIITIPVNLNTISVEQGKVAARQFVGITNLQVVTLKKGVEEIGEEAFLNCDKLARIIIPNSVKSIGDRAFSGCVNLGTCQIDSSDSMLTTIGNGVFSGCVALTYAVFPSTVTNGEWTELFDGCVALSTTNLPIGIKSIGDYAYRDCEKLVTIGMHNDVTYIGEEAFFNCKKIDFDDVSFDSLTTLGTSAFEGCSGLHGIKAVGATDIGENVYLNCGEITEITVIDKELSYYTNNTSKLTAINVIGNVESGYFSGCTALETVVFYGAAPDGVDEIVADYGSDELPLIFVGKSVYDSLIAQDATLAGKVHCNPAEVKFTYTVTNGGVIITGTDGAYSDSVIYFPEKIEVAGKSLNVVAIGEKAFEKNTDIKTIIIPVSVREIGNNAFAETGLETVKFESGSRMTEIGSYAFYKCNKLKEILVPSSVTHIRNNAFYGCTSLNNVTFFANSKLEYIGDYAFYNDSLLTTFAVKSALSYLGAYAFNIAGLKSFDFGTKSVVTEIKAHTFDGTKLESIILPSSLKTIGDGAFKSFDGTSVTIPTNVTKIGAEAFANAGKLITVTLNDNLTEIGGSAFENCTALTSIVIPDKVVKIGGAAFKNCSDMRTLVIGKSVQNIGTEAFYYTVNLQSIAYNAVNAVDLSSGNNTFYKSGNSVNNGISVTIGNQAKKIPAYLFNSDGTVDNAPKLKAVTFAETSECARLGAYSFAYCDKLGSIVIPVSVVNAESNVFNNCGALSINMEAMQRPARYSTDWNGNSSITYGYAKKYSDGYYYVVHNDKAYLTKYEGADTEIEIPTKIGGYDVADTGVALENNTTVTAIELPATATKIGSYYGCTALLSITINSALTEIQEYAFYGCSSLTYIVIGESVGKIGEKAFLNCTSLFTVYINSAEVAESMDELSDGGNICDAATMIYVLDGIDNIGSAITENYYSLGDIKLNGYKIFTKLHYEIGKNTTDTVYAYLLNESIADGTYSLTVDGVGNMRDFNTYTIVPWYGFADKIVSVTIGEKVTSLGKYAFYGLSKMAEVNLRAAVLSDNSENKYLFTESGIEEGYTLTVSDKVTVIPSYMFYGCAKLIDVVYHGGVLAKIGNYTFADCVGLTDISIPDTVTTIGNYAFYDCSQIVTVTIGKKVTDLGTRAFYDNRALKTLNFNATAMTDLSGDKGIFGSQYSIQSGESGVTVNIGSNIATIPSYLFYNCDTITSVNFSINQALTRIGESAFADCEELKTIVIPNTVSTIERNAFAGASALAAISFGNNSVLKYIGDDAFFNTKFYTTESNWKGGVLYLGTYLLEATTDVAKDYAVVDGTTIIAQKAFSDCNSLRYIHIPQTVVYINTDAFTGCEELLTVYMSSRHVASGINAEGAQGGLCDNALNIYISSNLINGLKITVGSKILDEYTQVESSTEINKVVYYSYTKSYWEVGKTDVKAVYAYLINDTAIEDYYVLKLKGTGEMLDFESANDVSWSNYIDNISKISVANTITNIGNYSFMNCINVRNVVFEETATLATLGISAFNNCSAITELIIPESVIEIKGRAFYNCSGLVKIDYRATNCADLAEANYVFANTGIDNDGITLEIKDSVTYIPANLFNSTGSANNAPQLAWVNFKSRNNVNLCANIGDYAFANCIYLNSVSFASGTYLHEIGQYAFENCTAMQTITISAGITAIGKGAFKNCANVSEIVFNATDFEEATEGDAPFEGVGKNNGYMLSVSIKTKSIPNYLFEDSKYLTTLNFLPDCIVETIGEGAFEDCTGLIAVTLPQTLKTIGEGAFNGCTSLQRYVAPFIGGKAEEVEASVYTTLGYVFGKKAKDGCTLTSQSYGSAINSYYIPDSLNYVEATLFTNVYFGMFQNCKNLGSVTINSVTGLQIVEKNQYDDAGALVSSESIINGSVLGNSAFENCSSLTSVKLAEQLTGIGDYAFSGCSSLKTITIPEYVTGIGKEAFKDCEWLTKVNFDAANCQDMVIGTFANAGTKQGGIAVTFGTEVIRVPAYAFNALDADVNVISVGFSGKKCLSIGCMAFAGLEYLNTISLPNTIVSIEENAFTDCGYYKRTENWNNGVLYIDTCLIKAQANLLVGNYAVTNRTTVIADYAFYECVNAETVNLPSTVTAIGDYAFYNCTGLIRLGLESSSKLTSIGAYAFMGCKELGSETDENNRVIGFTVTSEVVSIGDNAFELCESMTEVYIDSSTIALGLVANSGKVFGYVCGYAKKIYVNENIESVGSYINNGYVGNGTHGNYKVYEKRDN